MVKCAYGVRKNPVLKVSSVFKGQCQLGHMRNRVVLKLICMQLVAGFLPCRHCKTFSKISQQTISVFTKERFQIQNSANIPKMNAIQTNENSFLNSPTVFEKVGLTISKCLLSTRACVWGNIVHLRGILLF